MPERTAGGTATFYILDGSQPDTPDTRLLARLPDLLPQPVRLAGWRQAPALLAELGAEVDRRQKATDTEAAPIFLVLFGLHRFRDLRRQEDDYSFLRKGEETASPSQQFATLLREGAALGVHTLIWCDTLNNLQRAIDRQGMRELALRVALQMSVADS